MESRTRINAHPLQSMSQDDPRIDAGEQDCNAFAERVLQQSHSKDLELNTSLKNTSGELSNITAISFSFRPDGTKTRCFNGSWTTTSQQEEVMVVVHGMG